MRYSRYFVPTYKEVPADAEVVSHQLMLRAGMIQKLTSGIYSYLPAGLRAVRKVEQIIREEMNRAGALEILMPAVQPAELWQESGRWEHYGRELLRFRDRHNREACFGPTHEEVVTDIIRREIHSYRQLPVNLYQIQTKFRDEIRPRFGVMRAREFIMKDGYSFDVDEESANQSYELMYQAYQRIFERCGLTFRAVEADTGAIGGSFSHEFMVLAETGEDEIAHCSRCPYAANLERAEVPPDASPEEDLPDPPRPVEEVATPDIKSVHEVTDFLSISPQQLIKTMILLADDTPVAVLVRGDHELNEAKLKNYLGAQSVELAGPDLVAEITGAPMGFAGPHNLDVKVLADQSIRGMKNAVTGGNQKDLHLQNVTPAKDFTIDGFADLRMVTPEDHCPRCGGPLQFERGIEVGHIFKLGTKYSQALGAVFLDESGQKRPVIMGCYGIGVGRTVAAAIEQNHDEAGMIFPIPIAPFEATILPLQIHEPAVAEASETIYRDLLSRSIDVLLDDRNERAGIKFNDADLLGIPVRITVGSRGIREGQLELKMRGESQSIQVPVQEAASAAVTAITALYDSIKRHNR